MDCATLTKTEVMAKFSAGLTCAQCVLGQWADALGYDEEELHRMAAGFGGGMFRGDTCGAVTGALIALGLACGDDPDNAKARVADFQNAFLARFGSLVCRDLLGYDLSKPGEFERAAESGRLMGLCPDFVIGALEILGQQMKDL